MNQHLTLRELPGVDTFIEHPIISELIEQYGRELTIYTVRALLDNARKKILNGETVVSVDNLAADIKEMITALQSPSLNHVINATGIVLHTNLGRAPMGQGVVNEVARACDSYCNLEYDTNRQTRGERNVHVEHTLQVLTHAESALVINNNAAGLILTLNALAKNREVLVSRGELVEIGGSFRLPEIMDASGAIMVEVGTTNRTRVADYAAAVNKNTALILKVHKSNFTTTGFTEEAEIKDLVELAHSHNISLAYDIGSGLLSHIDGLDLESEPNIQSAVQSGCDLVLFSCDKLLAGPQAGAIVGRQDVISILMASPLRRALRVGKLTLAALSFVLRQWMSPETARNIPAIRMLMRNGTELKRMADELATQFRKDNVDCRVIESTGQYGGGTMPGATLDGFAVQIEFPGNSANANALYSEQLFRLLLAQRIPVLSVLRQGRLLIDVRTLQEKEMEYLIAVVGKAFHQIMDQPGEK